MYMNTGYLNKSKYDNIDNISYEDLSRPLVVTSCGEYLVKRVPVFTTHRPEGRLDYQLLYVAAGKASFILDGVEQVVSAGNMVLFRPGVPQLYNYYQEDHPQVFWVHFTGYDVEALLEKFGIGSNGPIFHTGVLQEFKRLYRQMIQELQLVKPLFEELLSSILMNLFILSSRHNTGTNCSVGIMGQEIEEAIHYFHSHFNQDISIEKYAKELHISTAWFIHGFKEHTGVTPRQYILSLRISNAQILLEQAHYSVTEIAAIVGYDNPLYFSRIFKKQLGISPQQYRQLKIRP